MYLIPYCLVCVCVCVCLWVCPLSHSFSSIRLSFKEKWVPRTERRRKKWKQMENEIKKQQHLVHRLQYWIIKQIFECAMCYSPALSQSTERDRRSHRRNTKNEKKKKEKTAEGLVPNTKREQIEYFGVEQKIKSTKWLYWYNQLIKHTNKQTNIHKLAQSRLTFFLA